MILLILSIVSIFATCLGPILAANTVTLALFYERTFTKVAELTGYFLMGVGAAGTFFVPSARVWGKRHLFILGTVIIIFSSVWAGASKKNYASMLWARIFQGIGTAPFEALVNASVGDLYFVHVSTENYYLPMSRLIMIIGTRQAYGADQPRCIRWFFLYTNSRW